MAKRPAQIAEGLPPAKRPRQIPPNETRWERYVRGHADLIDEASAELMRQARPGSTWRRKPHVFVQGVHGTFRRGVGVFGANERLGALLATLRRVLPYGSYKAVADALSTIARALLPSAGDLLEGFTWLPFGSSKHLVPFLPALTPSLRWGVRFWWPAADLGVDEAALAKARCPLPEVLQLATVQYVHRTGGRDKIASPPMVRCSLEAYPWPEGDDPVVLFEHCVPDPSELAWNPPRDARVTKLRGVRKLRLFSSNEVILCSLVVLRTNQPYPLC